MDRLLVRVAGPHSPFSFAQDRDEAELPVPLLVRLSAGETHTEMLGHKSRLNYARARVGVDRVSTCDRRSGRARRCEVGALGARVLIVDLTHPASYNHERLVVPISRCMVLLRSLNHVAEFMSMRGREPWSERQPVRGIIREIEKGLDLLIPLRSTRALALQHGAHSDREKCGVDFAKAMRPMVRSLSTAHGSIRPMNPVFIIEGEVEDRLKNVGRTLGSEEDRIEALPRSPPIFVFEVHRFDATKTL